MRQQIFSLLPQIGLLLITLLAFQQPITWLWFALIPIVLLMVMFGFGLATISARMTVHVADLNKLIPFVTRIVFYISGIFFSMEKVLANYPVALQIAKLNPVYIYISLARGAVVDGYSMTAELWISAIAWAFGTLLVGLWFFWKAEERYGREI